jgi:hypothetical protein
MSRTNKRMFKAAELESLCKIIADTNTGLTGTEIGRILASLEYSDIEPLQTKWKRLYSALNYRQIKSKSGNCVFSFISAAYSPSRFIGEAESYNEKFTVLIFQGVEFNLSQMDRGKL